MKKTRGRKSRDTVSLIDEKITEERKSQDTISINIVKSATSILSEFHILRLILKPVLQFRDRVRHFFY
jgi:hypothetical protein